MAKTTGKSSKGGHPIRIAARYAGLSPAVVRTWEKRYKAIRPKRAANDRRLYSEEDIQRLMLLRQVTQFGRRISEVAKLSVTQLTNIVKEDSEAREEESRGRETRLNTDSVMALFEQCLAAVTQLNTGELQVALDQAMQELGITFLIEDLITPLLHHVEEEYRQGELQNCHLRLLTETVRGFLMMISTDNEDAQDDCVVCAMRKDPLLTALRSAVMTNAYGWYPVYLGEDVGYYEICEAVEIVGARAVIVSFDRSDEDAHIPSQLRELVATLPKQAQLIINAPDTCTYSSVLSEEEAIHTRSLGELGFAFERLSAKGKGKTRGKS